MTDEQTKQAILGFTEFFKGITGNQDLEIPSDIAEKFGIERQKPSGDNVNRQAAIDANCYNCSIKANGGKCSKCDAVKAIEKLPPVKPQESKTGYWILVHPLQEDDGGSYMCSCCKWGHPKLDGTEKFCPNCGAKMIEPACDTCEYNTAAFNPCNACKDKSEYKPQESEK